MENKREERSDPGTSLLCGERVRRLLFCLGEAKARRLIVLQRDHDLVSLQFRPGGEGRRY